MKQVGGEKGKKGRGHLWMQRKKLKGGEKKPKAKKGRGKGKKKKKKKEGRKWRQDRNGGKKKRRKGRREQGRVGNVKSFFYNLKSFMQKS